MYYLAYGDLAYGEVCSMRGESGDLDNPLTGNRRLFLDSRNNEITVILQ